MQKLARQEQIRYSASHQAPLIDRLICWDLDETLGRFYGVYARMHGHNYQGKDGLKPGIREALRELSELGFTHVVTTAAPKNEAMNALLCSGLMDFFQDVFYEEDILRDNLRKDYSVVGSALGITDEEWKKKSIVVGDILPLDMQDNGVFIWEKDSPDYNAHITKSLILRLFERGGGDVWSGFIRAFDEGIVVSPRDHYRRLAIAEGFDIRLFYHKDSPVACIHVENEGVKSPLDPF